ncbi:MAG: hypothetical protein HY392_00540 [Candidatus Diapherotrites archaeon]|nr:hypothetical protein [Candidatus Diapherotrites archaeon]
MEWKDLDKDSLAERIARESGKQKEEIEKLVHEKKEKFAGLLTDQGASFMVAKELGLEIVEEKTSLHKLVPGMRGVSVEGKIVHVFPPKKFDKNGKSGWLQNLVIGDDAEEVRLTIWNEHVKQFEEQKIERNDAIELKNCAVSAFNEKKQLSLGFNGTIRVLKKNQGEKKALASLAAGQNSVDVECTLERVFEEKTFTNQRGEGKLLAFLVKDDSLIMRAVAWNEAISEIRKASVGAKVKIEGAYTKQSLNGVELNLGNTARVIVEPLA